MSSLDLRGVTVATVLPFHADGAIDWDGYARVLDYCAVPDAIAAVFVNGHAGEGGSLTHAERAEVIVRTRRQIGAKPLLAGIIAHGTAEAMAEARRAEAAGADCVVLFPPAPLGGGAAATPRAPVAYARAVAQAVGVPVSLFQYPLASGFGFSTETLVALAQVPGVIAVKEGSDDMRAYEENLRAIKAVAPHVAILPSNYNWFLAQLAVGGDGLLSGLASLTPLWLADLWRASEAQDLSAMRRAADRLYPVVRAIYAAKPVIDMHTRIKVGLKELGIIKDATPRPPLLPVLPEICADIARIVAESGLKAAAR
ncbi:dihydrodipicolinate synthase family protein [Xanthobacter sp. KR7-225]|uniref:dihydrodipicolinate synthase family protein n=1 Tax=Xanthobacter sp. KR7-225 TaxID=3156613 RepID=UPI0032B61D6F